MGKPTNDDVLAAGAEFGRYVIVGRLGTGGMGAVYEATHLDLKKTVAIKTLHPQMAKDPELRERFLREGQSAAKIRHPHVVDIYDVDTKDDVTYLVMEYLDGEDLSARLARDGRLTPTVITDLMLPVLDALHSAHEEGVVHRDLKPPNIFLAKGPHGKPAPKVLDFGISKILSNQGMEGLTTTGALLGTPFYMSPEQAHGGKDIDPRSDLYSLGVIFYQCVTGKKPFIADSMYQVLHKIVEGDFEPPRTLAPELPESFEAIILKAMARDPNDRYSSLMELGRVLLPFSSPRSQALWEPVFMPTTVDKTPSLPLSNPANVPVSSPAATPVPTPAFFDETPSPSINTLNTASGDTISMPKKTLQIFILLGILGVVAVGGVLYTFFGSPVEVIAVPVEEEEAPPPPPKPTTFNVKLAVEPSKAKINLDGTAAGEGTLSRTFTLDGAQHELKVTAPGYEPMTVMFRDAPPPEKIALKKLKANKKPRTRPRTKPKKQKPPVVVKKPPRVEKKPKKEKTKTGANQAPILR